MKPISFLAILSLFQNMEIRGFVQISHNFSTYLGDLQPFAMSSNCSQQLKQYITDLTQGKPWALRMLDAHGKIPSGILDGNFFELGSFDECINIDEGHLLAGKYCIGKFALSDTSKISIGICIPSGCTATDVSGLYNRSGISISESSCQTKESFPRLDVAATIVLIFLVAWLCCMVLSTAYVMTVQRLGKAPPHWLLDTFSFYTNAKKLFTTTRSEDEISCLHGIRVLSMMWIIMAHYCLAYTHLPIRNMSFILKFFNTNMSMFIIGAHNAVDTFFFISGLTLSYVFMIYSRRGAKFNVFIFYVRRYIRLTPAMGVVILLYAFLLKYMGSGPLWPATIEKLVSGCRKNWWKALLYIQNYDSMSDMCINPTWFLSVDTQLYLLSPLLLLPLLKWPNRTLFATGALTLCSIVTSFVLTWTLKLHEPVFGEKFMRYYYLATYSRAAPWLLGFMLGYLLQEFKREGSRIVMNKMCVLVFWIASIAILVTCVLLEYEVFVANRASLLGNAFNNALQRSAWAVCVGWVIYACHFGYGGVINSFLSSATFKVLSRLTYTAYISHILIQTTTTEQYQMNAAIGYSFMLESVWINFVMTFFSSLLLTLACESPLISMEKRLLRKPTKVRNGEIN
ncbi:hypothetical protein PPYR_06697 [Photinus pyralis]|uniref:Nose resistant-to-fluoxetine protein N-terminal domain-containing protein n=1 Tax=Photinus pyralis TaxID=7054 RepID=A0A1Y1KDP9_PHOPY|nr:O-acyltransferase like protein-like isoform X1 [Photinus pyralis]KAB0798817.1 hypothetical protein PPYR_06697 [Photinus pyralis]